MWYCCVILGLWVREEGGKTIWDGDSPSTTYVVNYLSYTFYLFLRFRGIHSRGRRKREPNEQWDYRKTQAVRNSIRNITGIVLHRGVIHLLSSRTQKSDWIEAINGDSIRGID